MSTSRKWENCDTLACFIRIWCTLKKLHRVILFSIRHHLQRQKHKQSPLWPYVSKHRQTRAQIIPLLAQTGQDGYLYYLLFNFLCLSTKIHKLFNQRTIRNTSFAGGNLNTKKLLFFACLITSSVFKIFKIYKMLLKNKSATV